MVSRYRCQLKDLDVGTDVMADGFTPGLEAGKVYRLEKAVDRRNGKLWEEKLFIRGTRKRHFIEDMLSAAEAKAKKETEGGFTQTVAVGVRFVALSHKQYVERRGARRRPPKRDASVA